MRRKLQRNAGFLVLLTLLTAPAIAVGQTREDEIVKNSVAVLSEVMAIPASQIPGRLLQEARGVAIIPGVVKGGFIVGVRHGRGVMLVRSDNGQWLPPMFVSLTGGSVGWQAGLQSTDVVLVFRTRKSVNNLMNGQLTLGVDAAAAAGPVGRQASAATDARLSAEILSYSRSRGLFAGVSFDGSVLQVDQLAGMSYYHHQVISPAGQPTYNPATLPPSALQLMNALSKYSGAPAITVSPAYQGTSLQQEAPGMTAHTQMVRQQLAASWQQLAKLLPDQWKGYLEIPAGVATPGAPVSEQALNITLQRYAVIAEQPQYLTLSQRPEFVTTYQLLREFATLNATSNTGPLALPSPPVNAASMPQSRY